MIVKGKALRDDLLMDILTDQATFELYFCLYY